MTRMNSLAARLLGCAALLWLPAAAQTGPMVGTVSTTDAHFLYRPGNAAASLRLSVIDANGQVVATDEITTDPAAVAADNVAHFHVTSLQAATLYRYKIENIGGASPVELVGPDDGLEFRTSLLRNARESFTIGLVSCANNTAEPVWERLEALGINHLVLGGDTPYIDVTGSAPADRTSIFAKHRAFLETPFLAGLIRHTPTSGTWDDHDFGRNNGNGVTVTNRQLTRDAFVAYRAHDQFGTGDKAVYHKVDLGTVELFLLDPRWFSQDGKSVIDPTRPNLFGAEQWEWLRESLRQSRAPFKVLVMGEIWQDKKNGENDDLYTYWYERDALYDFIEEEQIPGVVVVGGDIHVSRHLIHRGRLGYDLHDFVISPGHTSVIASLDVPHPDLEWSAKQPRQCLTLTADTAATPATLTARFYLADGTLQREVAIPYDQLVPRQGVGLGRDLRAWWDFEDLGNRAASGGRLDLAAVNGATLVPDGGLRGGAARLVRNQSQYLFCNRNALDDNTAAYTASFWCRAASLPAHGSGDRAFLAESTLGRAVSGDAGYGISLGLRPADQAGKILLEVHTTIVGPAGAASTDQPPTQAQGPFAVDLDRSVFANRWAQVVVTFDSQRIKIFVDGAQVGDFALPIPGPLAENAGLVLGGHRAGEGRNFDGLIDEVALWNRVLTPAEIAGLHELDGNAAPHPLPIQLESRDSDDDGQEDWWENLQGLNAHSPTDVMADSDGDGIPAWIERRIGTRADADDSALFSGLRESLYPGSNGELVFRDPVDSSLSFELLLQGSPDLQQWLPQAAPEADAEIVAGQLHFEVPPPENPWFLRLQPRP